MLVEEVELNKSDRRIAILIDGDNARSSHIERIIRETEKDGRVTIRRIYGNWTSGQLGGWKDVLHKHAIQPIQQFNYTTGKNATDSALIIDAMDILHGKLVDGFCIVSSDSDYTRLATRIREEGSLVIGIGEKKTPQAFVKSCDKFVYIENLYPPSEPKPVKKLKKKEETDLMDILMEAFEMSVGEDGWAHLAQVGTSLSKIDPGFDSRTFGYKRLSDLLKSTKRFMVETREELGPTTLYVRLIAE